MLAALLVVTLAAVFVNRALRSEGTVVSRVLTGPAAARECGLPARAPGTAISFDLARSDSVTVEVVRARGRQRVATLARQRELEGGRRHCLVWAASPSEGVDESGEYRLRFELDDLDRRVVAGEAIPAPAAVGDRR